MERWKGGVEKRAGSQKREQTTVTWATVKKWGGNQKGTDNAVKEV
jgi:hypothetical protein